MPELQVAVIKTGDTAERVRANHGDFDAMFLRILEEENARVRLVQAHRDEPLPEANIDAVVVTGSPHSVTRLEPWAVRLGDWLVRVHHRAVPIFGVCYGHQLLAHAFGGRVDENPLGYEIGTVEVELTEAAESDPIFSDLSTKVSTKALSVQSVHSDAVTRLPDGAALLAHNPTAGVQAFRIGDRTWGVQFHPEFTEGVMRDYVESRLEKIELDAIQRGLTPEERIRAIRAGIRGTPHARGLLGRFLSVVHELSAPGPGPGRDRSR